MALPGAAGYRVVVTGEPWRCLHRQRLIDLRSWKPDEQNDVSRRMPIAAVCNFSDALRIHERGEPAHVQFEIAVARKVGCQHSVFGNREMMFLDPPLGRPEKFELRLF